MELALGRIFEVGPVVHLICSGLALTHTSTQIDLASATVHVGNPRGPVQCSASPFLAKEVTEGINALHDNFA